MVRLEKGVHVLRIRKRDSFVIVTVDELRLMREQEGRCVRASEHATRPRTVARPRPHEELRRQCDVHAPARAMCTWTCGQGC
eukprot:scaffold191944_cov35-Tisochrysis_lutea.AAC.2